MSIDKFGRYFDGSMRPTQVSKGIGFKLTGEGDYDIQEKLLRNVGEPKAEKDAANKYYVDSKIPVDSSGWDFGGQKLINVKEGSELTDVINVAQLSKYKSFVEGNTILKRPVDPFQTHSEEYFDVKSKRMCNVKDPVEKGDVATKSYVDSKIIINKDGWDFKNMKLRQVGSPTDNMDAVNVDFLRKHAIVLVRKDTLSANKGRITMLNDGLDDLDAVNKRQLVQSMKVSETYSNLELEKVEQKFRQELINLSHKIRTHYSRDAKFKSLNEYKQWHDLWDKST